MTRSSGPSTGRDLELIAAPWDSGHHAVRMGTGPGQLLRAGLTAWLSAAGHRVQVTTVQPDATPVRTEIQTVFAVDRAIAEAVRAAVADGRLPIVLAGNCSSAVGTVAGLGASPAVAWFDAHADLNTPETTTTGFLDGMALAMLTGRCWTAMTATVAGFAPVASHGVLLVGARDLDPAEEEALARADAVRHLPPADVDAGLASAVERAAMHGTGLYVHVDLDVLDPADAIANSYATTNGMRLDAVVSAIGALGRRLPVRAAAITAYDAAYDADGRAWRAAFRIIEAIVGAVPGT